MPKYAVTLYIEASITVVVNAKDDNKSAEKAIELVGNPPMLCHHCSPKITIGDFTGEAEVELVQ